jgi:hypothetical protein
VLTLLAAGLYGYTQYLVTYRVEVEVSPPVLAAEPDAKATIHAYGVGRAGARVPWSTRAIRCELLQGAALVDLRYAADSSAVTIISRGDAGVVELRVFAQDWPFPLFVSLSIEPSLAMLAIATRTSPVS